MSKGNKDGRKNDRLTSEGEGRLFRSLRVKVVALLALVMLPAGVVACLQALSNYRQLSALSEESTLQAAILATQEDENVIIAARRVLKTLAVLPEIVGPVPGRCDATLAAVHSTSGFYATVALTNDRGEIVCGSPPVSRTLNVSDRPWYQSLMRRGAFNVTGGVEDMATGARVLVAGLPIFSRDQEITGALFLTIRTEWLKELLIEAGTPDVTHVALVDRAGNVIGNDPEQFPAASWLPPPGFLRANLAGGPRSMQILDGNTDVGVLAVAPLLQDDVYVVVGGAPDPLAGGSVWRLIGSVGFPIIMWVVGLAVAWLAVDRLAIRPILRLERTAAAFASGKQSVRASGLADMPAEIGRLGRTMNMMADKLAVREGDLQQSVDEQRVLLKELHHRVKNNLQMITSLLNLQIHRATGDPERRALRTTQDRIYALAQVHDSLYRVSGDGGLLRLDEILCQIAEYMTRGQDPISKSVRVHCDMDEVRTSSKSAVPIALLLTEAIACALELSRPDDTPDNLWITLKRPEEEIMVLTIESDRSSAKVDAAGGDDLSGKLAAGFVKQLGGQSTLETENGYRLRVTIPCER